MSKQNSNSLVIDIPLESILAYPEKWAFCNKISAVIPLFLGENKLPSVTTILSATKSEEEKAALANWKERVGIKEANRIKTEASTRGSSMQSYIEDYLRGRVNESFFVRN